MIRVQSQLILLTIRLKGYDYPLPFNQEALFFPNNEIEYQFWNGRRQELLSTEMKKNTRRMVLHPPKSELTESFNNFTIFPRCACALSVCFITLLIHLKNYNKNKKRNLEYEPNLMSLD